MAGIQTMSENEARKWVGHLVCAVLKDGSYYVGNVVNVKNGELILSGMKGPGGIHSNDIAKEQAKVSGLLGSLFGGGKASPLNFGGGGANPLNFGGGGANPLNFGAGAAGTGIAPAGNPLGGGLLGKVWPGIRIGFGMLKFLWPMVGKFLI